MEFIKNDIVYFVTGNYQDGFDIGFGIVDDIYSDGIYVEYLHLKENRLINGIPINDFKTPTKLQKLPKGWTYSTKLFDLSFETLPNEIKNLKINNPADIKKAIDNGYLVRLRNIDQCNINTSITKDGYMTIREYNPYQHKITGSIYRCDKLFKTYDDALKRKQDIIDEFTRQCNLSDEEWSKEQIEKTLLHYKNIYGVDETYTDRVRNFLYSLKNIEDIEVRISYGIIQYKYWKNKKWINLDPNAKWD